MKSHIFLLIFSLLIAQISYAQNYDSAPFWANHFGVRLAKIKEPKDIPLRLSFSARHLSEVKNEISNNSIFIPEVIYKVYLSQIFMIDAKKKRTIVDFKNFKNNRLFLNGKPISLKPNKSYDDYTFEVARILYPNKKVSALDLIFSKAHAQSGEGDFARFVASWFTSATAPRYMDKEQSGRFITSNIIASYENEADLARSLRNKNEGLNVTSLVFTCDKNVMTQVVEYEMVVDGRPGITRNNARRLINIPGGGYEFRFGQPAIVNSTSCSAKVNDSGVVQEVSGNNPELCPTKNLNIFNDARYFGGFPKAAQTCCQKEGCYEEVRTNLARIRQGLLGVPDGQEYSDPVAPSDAKSESSTEDVEDNFEDEDFGEEELDSGVE